MNRLIHPFMVFLSLLSLAFTLGFAFQIAWITRLWLFPAGPLSYIFI
jgi:hypothetical protein